MFKAFLTTLVLIASIQARAQENTKPSYAEARRAVRTIEFCIYDEGGNVKETTWLRVLIYSAVENKPFYAKEDLSGLHELLNMMRQVREPALFQLEEGALKVCP